MKKHGREYHALCPFHNEKSPSFTVNDEKGFFHCFGCGAHGDAIEFIRRFERLTYPEAIETLSRDAGIPIPQLSYEDSRKIEQEKTLYDVLEAATQWFERQLAASSGTIARDYIEKRGLKPETLRQFRIGYAPEDRNGLIQYLTQAGFAQKLQIDAGLIIVPEGGGAAYDRFRGRVMFPIRNASGKIVAFGGRLIANPSMNKNLPKYLNSPETVLFKKGEMLYNLDLAKRPAREGNIAVVMEGYMDVVMTAQSGIGYAVATLGTAVTSEHLRLLWQIAKEPVMCLDGDAAGDRAMKRAAEVALPLIKPGLSLRFATLPGGEDPDSYIQKHGKASFEKILGGSKRLSQTLWDTLKPNYKLNGPEGRAALDDACKQVAGKIADATVKAHYLSYFKKQLWEQDSKPLTKQGKIIKQQQNTRSPLVEQMVVSHHSAALDVLSQRLLKLVMHFPSLLHKSHVEESLSRLDIRNHRLDALRNTFLGAIGHTDIDHREPFADYVRQHLPDEAITSLIQSPLGIPAQTLVTLQDAEQLWNDTVSAYQHAHLQVELKELEETMGKGMDEATLTRMVELQHAIKKAHANRTFAPAETDIA